MACVKFTGGTGGPCFSVYMKQYLGGTRGFGGFVPTTGTDPSVGDGVFPERWPRLSEQARGLDKWITAS